MTRHILCLKCSSSPTAKLDDLDKRHGIKMRKASIVGIKTPEKHGYSMQGHFHAMARVVCDLCGDQINPGTTAIAVTTWRSEGYRGETEPEMWEKEFGEPIIIN